MENNAKIGDSPFKWLLSSNAKIGDSAVPVGTGSRIPKHLLSRAPSCRLLVLLRAARVLYCSDFLSFSAAFNTLRGVRKKLVIVIFIVMLMFLWEGRRRGEQRWVFGAGRSADGAGAALLAARTGLHAATRDLGTLSAAAPLFSFCLLRGNGLRGYWRENICGR